MALDRKTAALRWLSLRPPGKAMELAKFLTEMYCSPVPDVLLSLFSYGLVRRRSRASPFERIF